MIEIGRLCVKTAGRDAGCKCVVVDNINNSFVLIDGEARRRKCNISHLEPLEKKLDIKKRASHNEIASEFKKLKLTSRETKSKKAAKKPVKKRKGGQQIESSAKE